MDVRVLSGVHCVACGILEADLANTMGPMAQVCPTNLLMQRFIYGWTSVSWNVYWGCRTDRVRP